MTFPPPSPKVPFRYNNLMDKESVTPTIKFRPHHFLCMRFWVGNGYSEEYTEYVNEILPQVREGLPVEITFGPDSLCEVCPHLKEGKCESQERVLKFDRAVIDHCSLKEGQVVIWNEVSKAVTEKIMNAGLFSSICGDCSWAEYCHL